MKTLNFPLYHATSTLFEQSIKENGLGGGNPIKDFKVIELMRELEIIAKKSIKEIRSWKNLEYSTSLMTNQRIVCGGNYQHGETYLTPSIYTVGRYASNKYGSEAITLTFEIIDLLDTNGISIGKDLMQSYSDFFAIRKNLCSPIIYKLNNLPLKYLSMGERGETVEEQIKKIDVIIKEVGIEEMEIDAQQINFRVKESIPLEFLVEISNL